MLVSKVTTHAELEQVRQIRNACREWMTHDTGEIAPDDQVSWWQAAERELYLFDGVAYALLTERDGETWISLGVLPEHRGRGIGTRIYQLFPTALAEIRKDNQASRRAAEKAGHKIVSETKDLVVMQG